MLLHEFFHKKYNHKDDEDYENYYDEHPEDIPEGCAACGGDYPNCMDSCPIFDD